MLRSPGLARSFDMGCGVRMPRSRFQIRLSSRCEVAHTTTSPSSAGRPTWLGLEVLRTVDGGPGDDSGVVEFVARFRGSRGEESLHETSRFERRSGRWVYVDGDVR